MPISKEELEKLIKAPSADLEKFTTVSSDGRNLLTRIPREVVSFVGIEKGDKVRWLVKAHNRKLTIEMIKDE